MELYNEYSVKLIQCLPMDDKLFINALRTNKLLPPVIESRIKALNSGLDQSSYFLDNVIKAGLIIDDSSSFYKLLSVMQKSSHLHVENLGREIEARIKTDRASDTKSGMILQLRKSVITMFTQQ